MAGYLVGYFAGVLDDLLFAYFLAFSASSDFLSSLAESFVFYFFTRLDGTSFASGTSFTGVFVLLFDFGSSFSADFLVSSATIDAFDALLEDLLDIAKLIIKAF